MDKYTLNDKKLKANSAAQAMAAGGRAAPG
jgi:hypothetical protein